LLVLNAKFDFESCVCCADFTLDLDLRAVASVLDSAAGFSPLPVLLLSRRWRVPLRFTYFGFPLCISVLHRPVTDLDSSQLVHGCLFQFFVSARVRAVSSFPHRLFLKSEQYL
jgi:hypothetical protein